MQANIYLTGFMGCGKTTVGRHLAATLKREFIDTDERIVGLAGMSITEIFRQRGEEFFRDLESSILNQIARRDNIVSALGGGAVLRAENRALLKRGVWVFLDAPLALIERRVLGNPNRPLASGDGEALRALWIKRRPLYLEARIIVRCGNFAPDMICRMVQHLL